MKKPYNFHVAFDKINLSFNEKIDKLVRKARKEVVIPACKKYKLTFISGNGDYFFVADVAERPTLYISNKHTAINYNFHLEYELSVLDIEISPVNNFGSLMGDVKKEDY